jgi:hypothetical protein
MVETPNQATASSADPGGRDGHRRPVRGRMGELEGRWLMGRVAPPIPTSWTSGSMGRQLADVAKPSAVPARRWIGGCGTGMPVLLLK